MNLLSTVERGPRLPDFGTRMNPAATAHIDKDQKQADSPSRWQQQTANHGAVEFEAETDRATPIMLNVDQPAAHLILDQQGLNFDDD
jgi:hypothetical protein